MARGVPSSGGIFEMYYFSVLLEPAPFLHDSSPPGFFPVTLDCPSHYFLPSAPLLSGSGEDFVGGSWALWGRFTSLGDANEETHYWSW